MTYYTVYKIINQINGKLYIGSHKTKDLNDNYMGSGKYLNHAIAKHGAENFTKEILFVFETAEEMYAKEAELVTTDFIAESNTYNLKVGGAGGFDFINTKNLNGTHKGVSKRQYLLQTDPEWRANWHSAVKSGIAKISPETRQKMNASASNKLRGRPGMFAGKTHTDEAKKKISENNKLTSAGERNSQYGTMWITNGYIRKKIKNDQPIPEGWQKGGKLFKPS